MTKGEISMKDEIKEEIGKTEEIAEIADDRLDEVNGGAVFFSDAPKGSIVSGGKASTGTSIVNILGKGRAAADAPSNSLNIRRKSVYKNT